MAISMGQITEEKIEKKQVKLPMWALWVFILIAVFGTIFYFLFVQKPKEEDVVIYQNERELLSKDELVSFQKMIEEFNDLPLKKLKKNVSITSDFYPPPKKIGRNSNPFK